ncbi:MAG: hypothetical protein EON54_03005 [Alcaligenaceae bacterium]|nr:MAG: hypothetical protein EON54_03005 [Alcaligenaceae bacterium]
MKQKRVSFFSRSVVCAAIATLLFPADVWSAPLQLSIAPASSAYKLPAPIVIISVDDSGSMGDDGIATLRDALRSTFSAENVPDGTIRLGWQAMTGCYNIPSPGNCRNQNQVKILDSTHRARFLNWVDTLRPEDATPSHRMIFNAGQYLKSPPSIDSPWASVPGTTQLPMLSCRKAYNVFMTDGGWNDYSRWNDVDPDAGTAIGNADGWPVKLPDGTPYDTASTQTRIYRDGFGIRELPTLSDLAFHFWATDLQPSISNEVEPRIRRKGDQTTGTGNNTLELSQYWNPRNDPATWQHMTTYTVGFNAAADWNRTWASPKFGTDTWTGPTYDGLWLGTEDWTNAILSDTTGRMPELWHAALNGRGKFIPAPDAASLAPAFKDILNDIVADNGKPATSVALSAGTTRLDSAAYVAGYDAAAWSGSVVAYKVNAGTGTIDTNGLWGTEPAILQTATAPAVAARPTSTASIMDRPSFVPASRLVLSSLTTGATSNGIEWKWGNLDNRKKGLLNTAGGSPDGLGEDRLNFLRGDRGMEGAPFRVRESRHGDIVNSKLWQMPGYYTGSKTGSAKRPSMLYVGANDGMLHGFDAITGQERIAYVPEGLHGNLPELTRPGYVHRYFVDGSPFTADVNIGGWKSYLAGFPGAGQKGYFVLDVTDPTNFSSTAPSSLVVLDNTATSDADVGHMLNAPVTDQTNDKIATQITRMNDGRWALITGNGYNSDSEKAVLLIQYLDDRKELKKIVADSVSGKANGLSARRLIDLNGDGTVDVAYAGDLKGKLWKFNLSSGTPSDWSVAFGGAPLFSAEASQSITTAPAWMFHPDGGLMLIFGTGRNLTDKDRADQSKQTLYGLHDVTSFKMDGAVVSLGTEDNSVTGMTDLVAQTVGSAKSGTATTGNDLFTVSSNKISFTGTNAKKGWYLNFPRLKERSVEDVVWLRGSIFEARLMVPTAGANGEESCTPSQSEDQFAKIAFDAVNGGAPKTPVYAVENGVGTYVTGVTKAGKSLDKVGGGSVTVSPPNGGARAGVDPNKAPGSITKLYPTWRHAQ